VSSYLTQEKLAQYLHMPQSQLEPELAQFILDVAEDVISNHLERNPFQTEITELFDGNNGPTLNLTGYPVLSLTSVKENSAGGGIEGALILVRGSEFELDDLKGIIYRLGTVWCPGVQNIEVVYSYGPETTPNRVQVVGYQLAERVYLFGQDETQSTGQWSASTVKGAANLTNDELVILNSLKR